MNPPSKISTLAAIFGLSLVIWSYSPPLKAATVSMGSSMMDMGSSMMDMDLGPADAQYDLRFIDNMSMHHEDAITMALDALYKTERGEIRQLSQDIISSQSREIAQLQEWRQDWYPNAGTARNMDSGMMSMDLGPADAQYDLRFINNMSMHHQGAIEMAEDALNKSERDKIEQLSQEIIAAQTREFAQLEEWQQAWYPNAGPVAAVPEPSATLGLLTFGAFGIASVVKRSRTKQKTGSVVSKRSS